MLNAVFKHYKLKFQSPAGTSRGILNHKDSWFISLFDDKSPNIIGTGECSIIPNLSIDAIPNLEDKIENICKQINAGTAINDLDLPRYPSIRFALETALLDLQNEGKKVLFPSSFTAGKTGIKINGLIWMGDIDMMMTQLKKKIEIGFRCIKIKVGAIQFEDELRLLKEIRKNYSKEVITIRLDANGAFAPNQALEILEKLSKFDIHSIEQPIKQGYVEEMSRLCRKTPVPIALDEELIGINELNKKEKLLQAIKPQYIILKPSLLGGFKASEEWIRIAEQLNIGWWATSALESNIGLNAIAQWTFLKDKDKYHGLGTGQIYSNNIKSPLNLVGEWLFYDHGKGWDFV